MSRLLNWFDSMGLRLRLTLIIGPLVIAIVGLAAFSMHDKVQSLHRANGLDSLTKLAIGTRAMVDHLQRERGLSSLYLGAPTPERRQTLAGQWRETDAALAVLRDALQATDASYRASAERLLADSERLRAARGQVEARALALHVVLDRYTEVINGWLRLLDAAAVQSREGDPMRMLIAYHGLLEAQERAGLERALISNAIGSGQMSEELRERLQALHTEQRLFLSQFQTYALPGHLQVAAKLLPATLDREVHALREQAFSGGSVTPEQWWTLSTRRIDALRALADHVQSEVETVAVTGAQDAVYAVGTLSVVLLVALVAAALAALMAVGLRRRIVELQTTLQRIESEADLTLRVPRTAGDEIGSVGGALNRMLTTFSTMLGKILDASAGIAAPAAHLSSISVQTSNGIMSQKAQSEQVAAAMNEMAAAVQEVARYAAEASEAADRADAQAQEARAQLERMIAATNELAQEMEAGAAATRALGEDSREIDDIVTIIRGITEQTNLLALNASIEAARAGTQGRGFAVVANEVRTLATRTQESTLRIQDMVERLQRGAAATDTAMRRGRERCAHSLELAGTADAALEQAAAAVADIRNRNLQIATATEEQSAVAEEMNRNITRLYDLFRETSEGARETAKASERLAELAEGLRKLGSDFKH